MELRQLEHFLAVVEEGSFGRAAARVFMVQSSLSASVLALERHLGTELFIRGRRGAELTDAGRALLDHARAIVDGVDRARDAVAEVKGLLRGTVRIAAVFVPRSIDIIGTICRFGTEHPGVEVQILPSDPKSMVKLVADGDVDFAITPRVGAANGALNFQPLVSSPLAIACSTGHRLAGSEGVVPRDLIGESIIELPHGWRSRELLDEWCQAQEVHRPTRLEVDDWFSVLNMVQRGVGISYGPRECIDTDLFDGIAVAPLVDAPVWELGVATRDDALRGAAGRAFLAAYLEDCSNAPQPWKW